MNEKLVAKIYLLTLGFLFAIFGPIDMVASVTFVIIIGLLASSIIYAFMEL